MFARRMRVTPGPRKLLYKKAYGKFDVEANVLTSHRIILYSMQGYIFVEHIDGFITDLVEVAARYKPVGMIADPRQMKVLSPEFQRSVQTRFWPAIARLGVKRNPAIFPDAAVTLSSVNRMVSLTGETVRVLDEDAEVQVAMLPTLEDCIEWILQGAEPSSSVR